MVEDFAERWSGGGGLPVVSVDVFRLSHDDAERARECARAAEALHRFGALIVRDSRVSEEDNRWAREGCGSGVE